MKHYIKRKCIFCGNEFITYSGRKIYCSSECQKADYSHRIFPDGTDFAECKICKYRGKQIYKHIIAIHNISLEEYYKKFNCSKYDLISKTSHEHISSAQKLAYIEGRSVGWGKGDKNPSKRQDVKDGRKSIFSMNYQGYDGLTDDEKRKKIKDVALNVSIKRSINHNDPTMLDYYVKRGYSENEAKQLLKEHQTTFSLEKCIKKYGYEKGLQRFRERQEKWQKTLNQKPIEEINRINKAKAASVSNICAYSKISQELFTIIYNIIKNDYTNIYYATLNTLTNCNSNKNYEYEVLLEDGIHRYFLDFYVKDNNKVIEFDGDYWHSEKRGNQERDRIREEKLKSMGFINIFHVRETDYKINPEKVINDCINFIKA